MEIVVTELVNARTCTYLMIYWKHYMAKGPCVARNTPDHVPKLKVLN